MNQLVSRNHHSPKIKINVKTYSKTHFSKHPSTNHLINLNNYAFKIIIQTEILLEYGSLWWFDSSVSLENLVGDINRIKILRKLIQSDQNDPSCVFFPVEPASHNNYDVTCQQMMDYFMDKQLITGSKKFSQNQATSEFKFFNKNNNCWDSHYLPAFFCALNEDCIAPKGHQKKCNFGNNRYDSDCGKVCHFWGWLNRNKI